MKWISYPNFSAIKELAAGLQTASPRAIPILRTTNCQKSLVKPMTTHEAENRNTPMPMMIGLTIRDILFLFLEV